MIETCFPELDLRRSDISVEGNQDLVLEANRENVFRLPRFSEAEKRLGFEIELLPRLREFLLPPIQDYQFVRKQDGCQKKGILSRWEFLDYLSVAKSLTGQRTKVEVISRVP